MAAIVKGLRHAIALIPPHRHERERVQQVERDRRRSHHGTDTLFNTGILKGKAKRAERRAAHAEAVRWAQVNATRDNRRIEWPEGIHEAL